MKKRGLSDVITMAMIILIGIALVALMWQFIYPLIVEKSEETKIKTDLIQEDLRIRDVQFGDEVTVLILRGRTVGKFDSTEFENEIDVISATDVSGSMRCDKRDPNIKCTDSSDKCAACGGTWMSPIENAKAANKEFIDVVLGFDNTRVGLVTYSEEAKREYGISTDGDALKETVDGYVLGSQTCICCGINEAINQFNDESSAEKQKSLLLMSDGSPTAACEEGGNPEQDARDAACTAIEDRGITIYTVGIGDVDKDFMIDLATDCEGDGQYYDVSNIDDLESIYETIANQIGEFTPKFNIKLKIVFYNDEISEVHTIEDPPKEPYETKFYTFDTDISGINRVEIYPFVEVSGREITGQLLDYWPK